MDGQYSVNLIWINKELNNDERCIFPDNKSNNFLNNIKSWALENDFVNIWYDSATTTDTQVKNTKNFLKTIKNVEIKDISDLAPNYGSNIFSNKLPLYFRVDLIRAILAFEAASGGETFVYADMDMPPVSKKDLFDPRTVYILKTFGTVMAHGGPLGFENGFQIVSPHNENLLLNMNRYLIDLNLKRADFAIKNGCFRADGYTYQHNQPMNSLAQIVYGSYPDMFKCFYSAERWIDIQYQEFIGSKENLGRSSIVELGKVKSNLVKSMISKGPKKVKYPTKEVNLPPAGMEYGL